MNSIVSSSIFGFYNLMKNVFIREIKEPSVTALGDLMDRLLGIGQYYVEPQINKEFMNQEGSSLYVISETGKHKESLLGVLGKGGSKVAFQLAKGRALLLPNLDVEPLSDGVRKRWERMVSEEVALSKFLSSIGLLNPSSNQVNIALFESSSNILPAYICEAFESLASKDWFIIDIKNSNSSTWKLDKNYLFNSTEERLEEKNWDPILDSLLTDIAKILVYNLPFNGDSLNLVVIKKTQNEYEIRYFGFDFSSKYGSLTIPKLEKTDVSSSDIAYLADAFLSNIFYYEFGWEYKSQKTLELKNNLIKRYTNIILSRIQML